MTQTRKEFLKSIGFVTLGACCGGMFLSINGCTSVKSVNGTYDNKKITIKKTDFGEEKALQVKHLNLKAPIYISKISDTGYNAVLMLCTHKACELTTSGAILSCPCHGSEFATTGKVLEGPAETDLEKYKVTTEGENIIIHL